MSAVTAFIVLCTFLPFLPGRYDELAVTLSVMAQLLGKVGLVLVPVGAVWLAYELNPRPASDEGVSPPDKRRPVRLGALIASAVVFFIVAFAALVGSGLTLGLSLLTLWAYVVWRAATQWKRGVRANAAPDLATPLYLIVVPVAVVLVQSALAGPATAFSRNRAIEHSASLIADIEGYRAARGHYPPSLLSQHEDYDPSVMGIRRYQYEPSGAAYNVVFEQPTLQLGTREFVVYNPLDEQTMTSHNVDLLQLTPAELERARGFYAVRAASRPHWKSFLFD